MLVVVVAAFATLSTRALSSIEHYTLPSLLRLFDTVYRDKLAADTASDGLDMPRQPFSSFVESVFAQLSLMLLDGVHSRMKVLAAVREHMVRSKYCVMFHRLWGPDDPLPVPSVDTGVARTGVGACFLLWETGSSCGCFYCSYSCFIDGHQCFGCHGRLLWL